MIQQSKTFKVLDKKRLLERQNEKRVKYGLKPHKRIDIEFIKIRDNIFSHKKSQNEKPYLEGYA